MDYCLFSPPFVGLQLIYDSPQFIDDTPDLFKLVQSQNRAQKLLAYLGDLAVNGSSIKGQTVSTHRRPTNPNPDQQNRESQDLRLTLSFPNCKAAKTLRTDLPSTLTSLALSAGVTSLSNTAPRLSPRRCVTTPDASSWTPLGVMRTSRCSQRVCAPSIW